MKTNPTLPIVIPIPGCRTKEHVEENAKGALLRLAPEDVDEITKLCEATEVFGARYPEAHLAATQGKSLPLDQWKGE